MKVGRRVNLSLILIIKNDKTKLRDHFFPTQENFLCILLASAPVRIAVISLLAE